ncbi:MAG: hypothetical protein HC913_09050 [Microscillaceae bacterium]|nr:hypothetical protein [Microscillaceae bacterium]
MKTYEHLILGTGQATGTLLGRLIPTGASIGVIEGHQVGGTLCKQWLYTHQNPGCQCQSHSSGATR